MLHTHSKLDIATVFKHNSNLKDANGIGIRLTVKLNIHISLQASGYNGMSKPTRGEQGPQGNSKEIVLA